MNAQQLTLTRLLGKKDLTEGCRVNISEYEYTVTKDMVFKKCSEKITDVFEEWHGEYLGQLCGIIGHPPSLSDLHRWMNEKGISWYQEKYKFHSEESMIGYDSSKDLLEQSTETLDKIIELIKSNS